MAEIQTVFRDEALLESIWESAQEKLAANAPAIDDELKHLCQQRTKTQAALDRYYRAFESGTMTPETCNKRVEELTSQLKQMGEQHQALQEKRTTLDLPAMKMGFLQEILTNLKGVVDAVPIPQKKHLLHLLVKKVLICDRRTFEVWYRLPQFPGVRMPGNLVAPTSQYAKQTNELRFREYPHAIFRLSKGPPMPERRRTGSCRLLVRLAGLA